MDLVRWIEIIIAILSGVCVCIPLVKKLCETIKQLVEEKRWNVLVSNVFELMVDAEEKFQHGVDKKAYVMDAIKIVANQIGFDYDKEAEEKISKMIDEACDITKLINK